MIETTRSPCGIHSRTPCRNPSRVVYRIPPQAGGTLTRKHDAVLVLRGSGFTGLGFRGRVSMDISNPTIVISTYNPTKVLIALLIQLPEPPEP